MKRLAFFLLVGLLLLVVFVVAKPSNSQNQPNIVIVLIDCLRADALGCYGASPSPSPFIDSLAKRGTTFKWAYSQAPWTSPSVAALFTGLYYSDQHSALHSETLATRMKANGYHTFAYITNPCLKHSELLKKGFDEYNNQYAVDDWKKTVTFYTKASTVLNDIRPDELPRPFFLYIHLMEVHSPYHQDVIDMLPPADRDKALKYPVPISFGKVIHKDLTLSRRLYNAAISYVDRELKAFYERLPANTTFVITSDHGQAFFEHNTIFHGTSLYSEQVHIPLIVSGTQRLINDTFELRVLGDFLIDGNLHTGIAMSEAKEKSVGVAFYSRDQYLMKYERLQIADGTFRENVVDSTMTFQSDEPDVHQQALDKTSKEALKALGYLN